MKKEAIFIGIFLFGFSSVMLSGSLSCAAVSSPEPQRVKPIEETLSGENGVEKVSPVLTRDPFQWPVSFWEVIRQKQLLLSPPKTVGQSTLPVQPPPLKLQGILWSSSRPQAIIDRKIVSVGDVVKEAQIVEISKDSVKISYRNQEFQLKLLQRESERRLL